MLVCCVAPVSALIDIMQGAGSYVGNSEPWVCHIEAALMGFCLVVALKHVFPCARHMRARAAQIGFVLGLAGCAVLYSALQTLCWSTVYCAVRLRA